MSKYLIINADDFGLSFVFNEVILDLIKNDYIKSTTVMVNRIDEAQRTQINELISLSKSKNLSIGLHLEFHDSAYEKQINSQYKKFEEILGIKPSLIDLHKPHMTMDSLSKIEKFCLQNNLPMRNHGGVYDGVKSTYENAFLGSGVDFSKIDEWICSLRDGKFYEIVFHPGKFDPDCKSSLNKEREIDVKYIKDLRPLLEKKNIKVVSYLDLPNKEFQ